MYQASKPQNRKNLKTSELEGDIPTAECAKINGELWVLKSISGSDARRNETNKPTDDRGPTINMT